METLNLTKTIYGAINAHDSLNKEFVEFMPKAYTIDDLFDMYNSLFYDIVKEGKIQATKTYYLKECYEDNLDQMTTENVRRNPGIGAKLTKEIYLTY